MNLRIFYSLLNQLESKMGGCRMLTQEFTQSKCPPRGVYFFFEPGETRSTSGVGPRVVRVGTHALKAGGRATMRNRLSTHRGSMRSGGGNHRGSIFRLLVGSSLLARRGELLPSWGKGANAPLEIRKMEHDLEREVSRAIGAMPFLWLAIDDEPGPESRRGYIERNAIALLSNFAEHPTDLPSPNWLGRSCTRQPLVQDSGLWNSNHVRETCDPAFLDHFERLVDRTECIR